MKRSLRCLNFVLICALSLLFLVSALGCSGKQLSRSSAAELIRKSDVFKSTANSKVIVGTFWHDYRSQDDLGYLPLVENGILTLKGTGKNYAVWYNEYVAELTPKGLEAAKNWTKTSEKITGGFFGPSSDVTVFHIPLAQKELVQVTGIASEANNKQAVVEFAWKWVPTSDSKLAPKKVPSGETRKGVVGVQLYDDGWRIVQSNI